MRSNDNACGEDILGSKIARELTESELEVICGGQGGEAPLGAATGALASQNGNVTVMQSVSQLIGVLGGSAGGL